MPPPPEMPLLVTPTWTGEDNDIPEEATCTLLARERGYIWRGYADTNLHDPADARTVAGDGATIIRGRVTSHADLTAVELVATFDDAIIHIQVSIPPRGHLSVHTWGASPERVHQLARSLVAPFHREPPKGFTNVSYHLKHSSPERRLRLPTLEDIAGNYSGPVRQAVTELIGRLPPPDIGGPGIVVLTGPPGTGKTYLCRALMREASDRGMRAAVVADPTIVEDPGRILNMAANRALEGGPKFALAVVEDADAAITPVGGRSVAAQVLLSVGDGLLADAVNTIWVLTANRVRSEIDPALLRPGRCLAEIEVGPLSKEEASGWLGSEVSRPMTLAELFAARSGGAPTMIRHPDGGHGTYL